MVTFTQRQRPRRRGSRFKISSVEPHEVSIPVKAVSATENRSISFHGLHESDGGRVRNRKVRAAGL
jgi:hypothetical protein